MKRGDVFLANLTPRSGSEQNGTRPVIIVSHNGFNHNKRWRSVIVVPVTTSKNQKGRGPTAPFLPKNAGGLNHPSVALCHQVTTLDRSKLTRHLGCLTHYQLQQVDEGLKAALSLLGPLPD